MDKEISYTQKIFLKSRRKTIAKNPPPPPPYSPKQQNKNNIHITKALPDKHLL